MTAPSLTFPSAVERWIGQEKLIRSAVLFGSGVRRLGEGSAPDAWSDVDLHVGTTAPAALEAMDWARALPGQEFCFQVVRPATGGVRKATVLFAAGQIDLVLVPMSRLRQSRMQFDRGLHRRSAELKAAFDEFSTCLRSGYRFLKGEKEWGRFYSRVAQELEGVRLGDHDARQLAAVALTDFVWILQKLERGELSAAQHLLHRSLAETNFRLVRELRLRRGEPLPSFGLARRFETLLSAERLAQVQVDACLDFRSLRDAAWKSFAGTCALLRELVPSWTVPVGIETLLSRFERPLVATFGIAPRGNPARRRRAR